MSKYGSFISFLISFPCRLNPRIGWILPMLLWSTMVWSQENPKIFTEDAFLEVVSSFHPIAKQARLLNQQAAASMLQAKGGFDPKLYGDWDRKSFDGKNYFNLAEGGLKIPTWYGIEVKASYQHTNGIFLNPENTLPTEGQAIAGISMPLLQGLFIDDRRASLFKARNLVNLNEARRQDIVNDLLWEGVQVYWKWATAGAFVQMFSEAVDLAQDRFEGVREGYFQGDKPAIDTLEAWIQVQTRQLDLQEANVNFLNAGLELSNFLWTRDGAPYQLDAEVRPVPLFTISSSAFTPPSLNNLLLMAQQNHPAIRTYQFKQKELEIERRLKVEKLKPKLNVEYNMLGQGLNFNPDTKADINPLLDNNKWGVTFGFPVLLRDARGGLQLTDLKIQDNNLTLDQKTLEIQQKIQNYFQLLAYFQQQIDLAENMTLNYQRLLEAENTRFSIGESSIFLVNSRENKLLEAQQKLLKLKSEFFKTRVGLQWAAGQLGNN